MSAINFIAANASAFLFTFNKYGITTPLRMAHFLGQMDEETGGFSRFSENLNYSAARLIQIFPKYFPTIQEAQKYAGKPATIANKVYGGRMGNNNSTDGWTYRGRGLVQLTGKANYQAYKNYSGIDVISNPDLASRIDVALDVAGWFWNSKGLNPKADNDDINGITLKLNGGYNNLSTRKQRVNFYKNQDLSKLINTISTTGKPLPQ